MESRICKKCGRLRDLSQFRVSKLYKGVELGKYTRSECLDCEKKAAEQLKKAKKNAPNKPNKCECCEKLTSILVLDHDHSNGLFRGWICRNCNQGIGKIGDTIPALENAIKYLKKSIS